MSNDYYNVTTTIARQSKAISPTINAILASIAAGFELLPGKDALLQNRVTHLTAAGTANTLTASFSPAISSYEIGLSLTIEVTTTNTGAATLNLNSLGARSIKRSNGADVTAGDLTDGDIISLIYDGTNFVMINTPRNTQDGITDLSQDMDFTGAVTFDGTTLVVDDANNRVGMGTASPSYPLHVTAAAIPAYIENSDGSGTHALVLASGGSQCRVSLSDSASTSDFHVGFGSEGNDAIIYAGNTGRQRVSSTGELYLGELALDTDPTNSNGIAIRPGGLTEIYRGGTGGTHMEFFLRGTSTSTPVGSISASGSTTSYNTSSDQRLKQNIADADGSGAIIDAIQIRQFDWIAGGEHQRYGVIAQEVEVHFPEMVTTADAESDPDQHKSVDYSKLVPLLVKEVQSLRARLAALEA